MVNRDLPRPSRPSKICRDPQMKMYRFKKCDDATQTDRQVWDECWHTEGQEVKSHMLSCMGHQTVTTAGVLAHLEVRRGSRVAVLQCCSVADLHPNKGNGGESQKCSHYFSLHDHNQITSHSHA
ncbi:hypothetical protein O3P69_014549 [Scylla paramamosain]|uniref:Uncharacterized protein n=1 Tax=Scylla paramamosain TaxID=85552 RepID=A0AAW0SFJ5_SCYPA